MQKRNVIVVMLDSLGANDLGCYGNKWIKTPNLDRLAKEGVLFENNYIESLPTIPCRRSMHTGRYQLPLKGW
jgi:arylsulfatase A-like enzyme